jgi:hypothetical protein
MKLDNLHPVLKATLMSVGLSLVTLLIIVAIGHSDKVIEFNAGTQTITASYYIVYSVCFSWFWAGMGLLASGIFPVGYAIAYKGLSAGTGEYSGGHVYAIGWVLFLLAVGFSYFFNYGDAQFQYIEHNTEVFNYLKAHPEEAVKLFIK